MNQNPQSKIVIITGASSGIGAATARRLARDRMRLTLAARRLERLESVAAEVESLGGQALIVQTDVRQYADLQRMVQATLDRWGRIDVLLNNAGVGHDGPLVDLKPGRIRDEIHINLIAVIEATHIVLPIMLRQGAGQIVNVASLAGLIATPNSSIYSATKFAVNGFTDSLRRELAGSGVRFSAFCPGFTPSEISPTLKAHYEGQPDAPRVMGLMPTTYVADQIARLIHHPRRRVVVPRSWGVLVIVAFLFPGLADALINRFLPSK
jgi:short-subunit dehydrogenase